MEGCASSDPNKKLKFSTSDTAFLPENIEFLKKKCESVVKKLSVASVIDETINCSSSLDSLSLAKVFFDIQKEANDLLSRLRLVDKVTRSRRWNTQTVWSILTYKAFDFLQKSLRYSFDHLHSLTEQLFPFARRVPSFVNYSCIGKSAIKVMFSHPNYSPLTVLVKDYIQVLNQVDILWNRVAFKLRSFGENLNDSTILSTVQNELSLLSALVDDVTEKTEVTFHSIERQFSKGGFDMTFYKRFESEHQRVKKISRRLDDLRKLLKRLEGSSVEIPWFDFSIEGSAILHSAKNECLNLTRRAYEVWLRQLELREILKVISIDVNSKKLPISAKLDPTKTGLDFLSCFAVATVITHRKCCCLQRLSSSRSDPCFTCLVCLRRHQRYSKVGGESYFASDSDTALRHQCRNVLVSKATSLDTGLFSQASQRFRTLPFPHSTDTLRSIQSNQQSMSSKDDSCLSDQMDSVKDNTPVEFVHSNTIKSLEDGADPVKPLPLFGEIPVSLRKEISLIRTTSISPNVQDGLYQTSLCQQQLSAPTFESTLSILSSIDAELDSDDDRDIALSRGIGDEPGEDSALVTSPTSCSLMSQDSDDEEENTSVDWSVLRSQSTPLFSNQLPGGGTIEEAYAPITSISGDTDANESEPKTDLVGNTRTKSESILSMAVNDSICQRAGWSRLSCRSEDLAILAAALRLPSVDSARLHEVLQEGFKLVEWLSKLETSIYSPSEDSSICRLRPGVVRAKLDEHISELQLSLEQVQHWRQEADTLVTKQKGRLADFDNQANKLLASDYGILAFIPSWLDVIYSRCVEVERELRFQLRLSDRLASVNEETEKELQELAYRAEPVLAEAASLLEQLEGSRNSPRKNIGGSYFKRNASTFMAVAGKLQDLLECTSELDLRLSSLPRQSVKAIADIQLLRARLRNSLAKLQNLYTLFAETRSLHPDLSKASHLLLCLRRYTEMTPFMVIMFISMIFLCHAFIQIGWFNANEVQLHRSHNSGSVFCFASMWSHSLCFLLRPVVSTPSSNGFKYPEVPPT